MFKAGKLMKNLELHFRILDTYSQKNVYHRQYEVQDNGNNKLTVLSLIDVYLSISMNFIINFFYVQIVILELRMLFYDRKKNHFKSAKRISF